MTHLSQLSGFQRVRDSLHTLVIPFERWWVSGRRPATLMCASMRGHKCGGTRSVPMVFFYMTGRRTSGVWLLLRRSVSGAWPSLEIPRLLLLLLLLTPYPGPSGLGGLLLLRNLPLSLCSLMTRGSRGPFSMARLRMPFRSVDGRVIGFLCVRTLLWSRVTRHTLLHNPSI